MIALAPGLELDRGLGDDLAVGLLLDDDPEALEGEEVLLPAGRGAQQQLERGVGHLEVVAGVLQAS